MRSLFFPSKKNKKALPILSEEKSFIVPATYKNPDPRFFLPYDVTAMLQDYQALNSALTETQLVSAIGNSQFIVVEYLAERPKPSIGKGSDFAAMIGFDRPFAQFLETVDEIRFKQLLEIVNEFCPNVLSDELNKSLGNNFCSQYQNLWLYATGALKRLFSHYLYIKTTSLHLLDQAVAHFCNNEKTDAKKILESLLLLPGAATLANLFILNGAELRYSSLRTAITNELPLKTIEIIWSRSPDIYYDRTYSSNFNDVAYAALHPDPAVLKFFLDKHWGNSAEIYDELVRFSHAYHQSMAPEEAHHNAPKKLLTALVEGVKKGKLLAPDALEILITAHDVDVKFSPEILEDSIKDMCTTQSSEANYYFPKLLKEPKNLVFIELFIRHLQQIPYTSLTTALSNFLPLHIIKALDNKRNGAWDLSNKFLLALKHPDPAVLDYISEKYLDEANGALRELRENKHENSHLITVLLNKVGQTKNPFIFFFSSIYFDVYEDFLKSEIEPMSQPAEWMQLYDREITRFCSFSVYAITLTNIIRDKLFRYFTDANVLQTFMPDRLQEYNETLKKVLAHPVFSMASGQRETLAKTSSQITKQLMRPADRFLNPNDEPSRDVLFAERSSKTTVATATATTSSRRVLSRITSR